MSEQQDAEHWAGDDYVASGALAAAVQLHRRAMYDEPKVCGDVLWCGLPAGHEPLMMPESTSGHAVVADGVYDIPADVYHADPHAAGSLSSTGAKRLLPPSCPAKFDHVRSNGQPDRAVWDVGRAAHTKILGVGALAEVVDPKLCAKDGAWSTKEAKAEVARIRAKGHTPVKPETAQQIDDMAEALLKVPDAVAALVPGKSEQALFWTVEVAVGSQAHDVTCRTLLDKLPEADPQSGRLILADYKTCASADPANLSKAMHDNGYHQQAEWAISGVEALNLCAPGGASMVFVCQEKTPPYVVTCYYPDGMALYRAQARNVEARRRFAWCSARGEWPGYVSPVTGYGDTTVIPMALPPWAEREEDI